MAETEHKVKSTRRYRLLHKYIAIPVFIFVFLIAVSGLLLGWKKQSNLLPPTQKSEYNNGAPWMSIELIIEIANRLVSDSLSKECKADRLDIRPEKGVVKVLFTACFYEVQIDGRSGMVLSHGTRYSDIIERIHDGSFLDYIFGDKTQFFKIGYTTWLSLSLMILSISGFFLWYNPKVIRKMRKKS